MKMLRNWLDDRTGLGDLLHEALYERIPGGSRWRYVWGSTLVFAFFTQLVTGFFLWLFYSPSSQTAWESVYYIQYELSGGWLLRGLHHFMAQVMVVLLALHLMQVVIDGAYRAPREVNFWTGLILMQVVLGLSLTGYLLPWDQKGFWATKVATNLMGVVPRVGPALQQLVVGGNDYGHHTLTHFFALHAGLLPALLIGLLVIHLALFRRHGITPKDPDAGPEQTFWPDQVLKDAVAALAVLCVVLGLVLWPAVVESDAFASPGDVLGADLGAPADPASPYAAARPEWYFLFLYQFLKYFPGESELYGAIVIPGAVMLVLFLMPLVGRWRLGHGFNVALLFALLVGIVGLTVVAVREDRADAAYRRAVEQAERDAQRAKQLARHQGIPVAGALTLLRNDPKTQGPRLFESHGCSSCHLYEPFDRVASDHAAASGDSADPSPTQPPGEATGESVQEAADAASSEASAEESTPPAQGAPNLYGFASRSWIAALLDPDQIAGPNFFGRTKHVEGEMVGFVQDSLADLDDETRQALADAVVALSAEAALPAQRELDRQDQQRIEQGRVAITETLGCTDCHRFHDAGELGMAPDLTGYGSREWLIGIIRDPTHERFYGENNDRMPAFADRITEHEIGLLADWLRGDWFEPQSQEDAEEEQEKKVPATDTP